MYVARVSKALTKIWHKSFSLCGNFSASTAKECNAASEEQRKKHMTKRSWCHKLQCWRHFGYANSTLGLSDSWHCIHMDIYVPENTLVYDTNHIVNSGWHSENIKFPLDVGDGNVISSFYVYDFFFVVLAFFDVSFIYLQPVFSVTTRCCVCVVRWKWKTSGRSSFTTHLFLTY